MTIAGDAHETIVSIVSAVSRVHMVGNPTPRTRAEAMVVMIGKLFENLPIIASNAVTAQRQERFSAWQSRGGEAQKQSTEVCRVDLGYSRLPRIHWWQPHRPRTPEERLVGWPGPTLELDDPSTISEDPAEATG